MLLRLFKVEPKDEATSTYTLDEVAAIVRQVAEFARPAYGIDVISLDLRGLQAAGHFVSSHRPPRIHSPFGVFFTWAVIRFANSSGVAASVS